MREVPPHATPSDFVPALGRPELTGVYDLAVALLARELKWRASLMRLVAPTPDEISVDVGYSTSSAELRKNCTAWRAVL